MIILCNRCKEKQTDFSSREEWSHIEYSEKGYGKIGDYFLCPECTKEFTNFIHGKKVQDE